MSFLRPEAVATLLRWREVAAAAGVLALGLWVASWGGWFWQAVGLGLAAVAVAFAVQAGRRLRFSGAVGAPGIVEVVERRITYFGPTFGGAVSLDDLAELRLVARGGVRAWGLRQADGQALIVPAAAQGAEAMFDAFSVLPGLSPADLLRALQIRDGEQVVWRRAGGAARIGRGDSGA